MAIPATLHFCWIGPRLPWAYAFGVLSAVERGAIPDIVLHHTDALDEDEPLRLLRSFGVRLSRVEPTAYLSQTGYALGLGNRLAELYEALTPTVMRADLLRAAILYTEGGIYLDLDTVTVASLWPLLNTEVFLSSEFIVWPRSVRQSRAPLLWARHLTLDAVRKACRRAPLGWKVFRCVQGLYVRHVNNAIMGTAAHSAFFSDYLREMADAARHPSNGRYALGPTLLQHIADRRSGDSVHIHRPDVFSPLPPEISEHWFRITRYSALPAVLLPETRVVHWYASVRTRQLVDRITPSYVADNRHRQLYSALVYSCIGNSAIFRSLER